MTTIDLYTKLADIQAQAQACRTCDIGKTRTSLVFSDGIPCDLVIVGEGPGEKEDKTSKPFVGKAGQLLDKMLAAIGRDRTSAYFCNVVKCRACDRSGQRLVNRPPTTDEVEACRPFLDAQLRTLQPKAILALGSLALKWFYPGASISRDRGTWIETPYGPLIATFHPSYVLRQEHNPADKGKTKRAVWNDLKLLRERLDYPHQHLDTPEDLLTYAIEKLGLYTEPTLTTPTQAEQTSFF